MLYGGLSHIPCLPFEGPGLVEGVFIWRRGALSFVALLCCSFPPPYFFVHPHSLNLLPLFPCLFFSFLTFSNSTPAY